MELGIDEIKKITKLAMLGLKDEEIISLKSQMGDILTYIELLNTLDTSNIDASAVFFEEGVRLREDELKPSLGNELALKNAPQSDGDYFLVPKII